MLNVEELEAFTKAWVSQRQNLEGYDIIADEDEYAGMVKDIKNKDDQSSLVVLLPNFDSDVLDEDHKKLRATLYFLVVKKTDRKAGKDVKFKNFSLTQKEARELIKHIISLKNNFGENCIFKDIDLPSIRVTPVSDYQSTNGWEIEFSMSNFL